MIHMERSHGLTVEVDGLRNDDGHVLAALYEDPDAFPDQSDRAVGSAKGLIQAGRCQLQFEGLEPGEYAVALLHDENDNGECDRNLFGIPREGIGMSGYEQFKLEVPSFETARFTHPGGRHVVHVKVHYLG